MDTGTTDYGICSGSKSSHDAMIEGFEVCVMTFGNIDTGGALIGRMVMIRLVYQVKCICPTLCSPFLH